MKFQVWDEIAPLEEKIMAGYPPSGLPFGLVVDSILMEVR